MSLRLEQSLKAWNTGQFGPVFQQEVAGLTLDELPLQQALNMGSHALQDRIQVMVNHSEESSDHVQVRAGIFFESIIAGCSCADDPTPIDTQSEYCELEFTIDKATAQTAIRIL